MTEDSLLIADRAENNLGCHKLSMSQQWSGVVKREVPQSRDRGSGTHSPPLLTSSTGEQQDHSGGAAQGDASQLGNI